MKVFSASRRPVHLGPYPLEDLPRGGRPDLTAVPGEAPLSFERPEDPASIVNAMADHQAMMDVIRDGTVNAPAEIPDHPRLRARHLKSFGYFNDISMVGICRLPGDALRDAPLRNPGIDRLAEDLRTRQTKTLASGIDLIMADLKDSIARPAGPLEGHTHALVFLTEHARPPRRDEPGTDWIMEAEAHRGCLRATEVSTVLASYIRLLGFSARAHSATTSDVWMNRLAVAAGLAEAGPEGLIVPFLPHGFSLSVITTDMELAVDRPLAQGAARRRPAKWRTGYGLRKSARTQDPYTHRNFADGPHPFETLKRVDRPTTYIDEPNIPRVPKRTDMFARAQFGDLGKAPQAGAAGGYYARKSAPASAQRRLLGAFVLLQDGETAEISTAKDPARNALNLKATSYWLGSDASGLSRCPDWAWYSHDARGDVLVPPHDQALSIIVDQGFETMEGASGDDWISVAQSMRAYLRFSLLGGVMARQMRNLGYKAKAHTVLDGEVLQPPLLLLSGLGEVSRIGEVILNPFLGPRLKSGVVTTTMPMTHDKPIDFGLQSFCEACNKCARECPSGAITAGPKLMFNGYEIWKSDSQKCATYRITTEGGAMCGRCMKTCPWNLEGVFKEAPFRWTAMNVPRLAPLLAKADDWLGRGGLNPVKKWWWDIELYEDGAYKAAKAPVNARGLQRDLDLKYEDQTLAVYPAPLAPHPWPFPDPMDREAGIAAYQAMVTAEEHKALLERDEKGHLHIYSADGTSPVIPVVVSKAEAMSDRVTKYEFTPVDGGDLPEWTAGAHLDVVVAPEYLRQYSMSGDPADRSKYQIGVLREDEGRGGSKLLHRIFTEGRRVFISRPINHFHLVEEAEKTLLFGGGIGVTPMIAFAHRLSAIGRPFHLHYSVPSRGDAGYLEDLAAAAWADHVTLHVSDEGTRADLPGILAGAAQGTHVYTCGPEGYMSKVVEAAEAAGLPEEAIHLEYFSVPEQPEYENHPFTIELKDGRTFDVPADQTATDVLNAAGVTVDVKCSDGICGVCKVAVLDGAVEHRDFVLSKAQREGAIILCQSRAAEPVVD